MKKQDTRFEVKTVSEYACIEVGTFYEMEDSGIKFAYAAEFANYFPYAPMCYVCKDVATAETVAGKLAVLYNEIVDKKTALVAAAKSANSQAEIVCFNVPTIMPVMADMVEFEIKTDEGKDYAVEAYLIEDIADLNGMDAMFAVPAKALYHIEYNVRKWWIQAAGYLNITSILRNGIYFIPEADFTAVSAKADELRLAYNEESRQRIAAALQKRGLVGEIINNASGEWWVNLPDYNASSKSTYNNVERVLDYIKNFDSYEDKN